MRPLNRRELNHKSQCIIQMVGDKTGMSNYELLESLSFKLYGKRQAKKNFTVSEIILLF